MLGKALCIFTLHLYTESWFPLCVDDASERCLHVSAPPLSSIFTPNLPLSLLCVRACVVSA